MIANKKPNNKLTKEKLENEVSIESFEKLQHIPRNIEDPGTCAGLFSYARFVPV